MANSFLDNPIIPEDDDPTVDATTSTDRRDSPSSLAGVPAGSITNDVQNTQNGRYQHMMQSSEDEEEGKLPGERPARWREYNLSSHDGSLMDGGPSGGGVGQEPPTSAGRIHDIFTKYEKRFGPSLKETRCPYSPLLQRGHRL